MSSLISQTERFKKGGNGLPGPGHYHEISQSKKKLVSVPEVPFKQSEVRFKQKVEDLHDKMKRQKLKKYIDGKQDRARARKVEYVNQLSSFSSGVDRFDKKLAKAPPLTKYQPVAFTDKLVSEINQQKSKQAFIQEKKFYEEQARRELLRQKAASKAPEFMDKEQSKAQMDELGFVNGGKFLSLIGSAGKPGVKKRDFQYVS